MATFPGAIATFRTMVNRVGVVYDALKTKVIYAEDLNKHSQEIAAIETELGINTKGVYADVKAWLTALAGAVSGIVTTFLGLSDTPASYASQGGKVVKVKADESGLEFGTGGGGGAVNFVELEDVPASYTDQAGKVVSVKGDESGLEFIDPPPADVVLESDFNAQTILRATADDTPTALTIGEQTVVGRITDANIAALTVSQLQTLLLSLSLTENLAIFLTDSLSDDGKYSGICENGTAGATLVFGELCYFNNDDSRWEKVDANLSDGYDKKLGMCVLAAANNGSPTKMLLFGKIRADALFPSLTIGAPVYMSETAGEIVVAQPTTANVAIRIIGFGNTENELYFCPSPDYIVHV